MATSTLSPTRLREHAGDGSGIGRVGNVDRRAGVIRNVKVLGKYSPSHNREYSDAAMRQAARLYEGCKVNIDHPPKDNPGMERSTRDTFGELRNVRVTEGGVYADLHFIRGHRDAEWICDTAERMPRQIGLSHNADGSQMKRGGKWIVESVDYVRSVDLVGKPGSTAGLFENENPDIGMGELDVAGSPNSKFHDAAKQAAVGVLSRTIPTSEKKRMLGIIADLEEKVYPSNQGKTNSRFNDDGIDEKAEAEITESLSTAEGTVAFLRGDYSFAPRKSSSSASRTLRESSTRKTPAPALRTNDDVVSFLRGYHCPTRPRTDAEKLVDFWEPTTSMLESRNAAGGSQPVSDATKLVDFWRG